MITIAQSEMDLILNRKIRKRTLTLPVRHEAVRAARHPKTGRALAAAVPASGVATKRCPVVVGGSYALQARPPHERYDQWLAEAEAKPTRTQSVLWLIDRCEQPRKTIQITIHSVTREGDEWLIAFSRDEEAELRDFMASGQPVFLGRNRDYTTARDELGAGEVLTPFAEDLEKARQKAREGIVLPQREALKRAAAEAATCREVMRNMKARNLVKRAQRDLEAAERILLSEAQINCGTSAAPDGSQGEEERPPCGALLATPKAA